MFKHGEMIKCSSYQSDGKTFIKKNAHTNAHFKIGKHFVFTKFLNFLT